MSACPRCGTPHAPGDAACAACGFELPHSAQPVDQPLVNPPLQPAAMPAPVAPSTPEQPTSSLAPTLVVVALLAPITVIGLPAGPVVWILARSEKKKIERGELSPSAAVNTALILGAIDTVLLILVLLFCVIWLPGIIADLVTGASGY